MKRQHAQQFGYGGLIFATAMACTVLGLWGRSAEADASRHQPDSARTTHHDGDESSCQGSPTLPFAIQIVSGPGLLEGNRLTVEVVNNSETSGSVRIAAAYERERANSPEGLGEIQNRRVGRGQRTSFGVSLAAEGVEPGYHMVTIFAATPSTLTPDLRSVAAPLLLLESGEYFLVSDEEFHREAARFPVN